MSRKPIIAANWKMNIGPAEGAQFIESFKTILKGKDVACDTVIVPPFTTIPSVLNALGGCGCIAIGAQNVSQYDNGAYTGEISTSMLQELGLKYVVLGHSERRQYFGETDAIINAKIKKAIAAGITPIFCIGETKDERLGGILEPVLEIQLKGGLKDLTPEEVANLVIAYEPVWAIGTGLTATSQGSPGSARLHPQGRCGRLRRRYRRQGTHPVRRFGEAGKRGRTHGPAGH